MHLIELLQDHSDDILTQAEQSLRRAHLHHYERDSDEKNRERLNKLYLLSVRCIAERNVGPMIAYAQHIGEKRFAMGFDLFEVQTAFNVLEECIWRTILKELEPSELAEGLGLVSTVIGAGKDALARAYVSMATKSHAASMDLRSIFSGTEGA